MSAFDYTRPKETAERLIARYGQAGAIRRTSSVDPATPYDSSDDTITTTDHPCTVVVLEYDHSEIDGTLILATDRRALVSTEGMTIEPATKDRLVIGAESYAIVTVTPLNPGGTVLLWDVQARR